MTNTPQDTYAKALNAYHFANANNHQELRRARERLIKARIARKLSQ